jgi:DNA-binding response OmpR family regulator
VDAVAADDDVGHTRGVARWRKNGDDRQIVARPFMPPADGSLNGLERSKRWVVYNLLTVVTFDMKRTAGTVLVVDDDSGLRSLYRCWLAQSYEVRTAADGVDGLRRLDGTVDVVLLDREMPRKDGVAVAREIDRREVDPAVVMLSGVEPSEDLFDIPVDDYLRKPASRESVLAGVQRAQAVAEQSRPRRHLLSLATRRRVVEESVSMGTLTGETAYQSAVDVLEHHSDTLDAARRDLSVAGRSDGPEPPKATSDPSLRKSP